MAYIELVIKIPEEIYKASQILDAEYEDTVQIPLEVIVNGTPLPKGHGRLIDANQLEKEIEDYSKGAFAMTPEFLVKDAPTIIEADKAESEVKEAIEMSKVDSFDKMRAEIVDCLKALDNIEKSGINIYLPNEISGRRLTYHQCLEIIDKYRTESEE